MQEHVSLHLGVDRSVAKPMPVLSLVSTAVPFAWVFRDTIMLDHRAHAQPPAVAGLVQLYKLLDSRAQTPATEITTRR